MKRLIFLLLLLPVAALAQSCPDWNCDWGEDCSNCPEDCPCAGGTHCEGGTCVADPTPEPTAEPTPEPTPEDTPTPPCEPNCYGSCDGRGDGCGGYCTTCPSGQHCNGMYVCEADCVPDCTGKQCGNDGCDGSCGDCSGQWPTQVCSGTTCTTCGNSGCDPGSGEDCSTCPGDCPCSEHQECQSGSCVDLPWCGDASCNGDETCASCWADCAAAPCCGQSGCENGEDCANCPGDCGSCCGQSGCQSEIGENCYTCPTDCTCDGANCCQYNSMGYYECAAPNCSGKTCGNGGCSDTDCGTCDSPYYCGTGFSCVCDSDCLTNNWPCGPDQCGSSCGSCETNFECQDHACVQTCFPDCTDKTCGTDGCVAECGTCDEGYFCNESQNCELSATPTPTPTETPTPTPSRRRRTLLGVGVSYKAKASPLTPWNSSGL